MTRWRIASGSQNSAVPGWPWDGGAAAAGGRVGVCVPGGDWDGIPQWRGRGGAQGSGLVWRKLRVGNASRPRKAAERLVVLRHARKCLGMVRGSVGCRCLQKTCRWARSGVRSRRSATGLASSAAARGTSRPGSAAPRSATGASPASGTGSSASGSVWFPVHQPAKTRQAEPTTGAVARDERRRREWAERVGKRVQETSEAFFRKIIGR